MRVRFGKVSKSSMAASAASARRVGDPSIGADAAYPGLVALLGERPHRGMQVRSSARSRPLLNGQHPLPRLLRAVDFSLLDD